MSKRAKMDTHFEVILERVKQLTEKSQQTVWYEIHSAKEKSPTIILINAAGNIGYINVSYENGNVSMYPGKLTKKRYERLSKSDMDLTEIKKANPSPKETPGDVVKWVSGVS